MRFELKLFSYITRYHHKTSFQLCPIYLSKAAISFFIYFFISNLLHFYWLILLQDLVVYDSVIHLTAADVSGYNGDWIEERSLFRPIIKNWGSINTNQGLLTSSQNLEVIV